MLRVLPVLIVLGLTVYALIDCAGAEPREVRLMPKPAWLLLIALLPPLGALGWLLRGRPAAPSERPGRDTRPLAPDDDPDFLRSLRRPDEEPEDPAPR